LLRSFDSLGCCGFVDVVRDDPTNNVPDTIFYKLGLQLHRRDQHPLGILKNTIYDYFDTNYSNKFDKFDELCPIVSVKQVKFFN
jgi:phenylalanyl-tRNA synthetase alpha chain